MIQQKTAGFSPVTRKATKQVLNLYPSSGAIWKKTFSNNVVFDTGGKFHLNQTWSLASGYTTDFDLPSAKCCVSTA